MGLKYYIATSLKRMKEHNQVRDLLEQKGHTLTYDWTTHGSQKTISMERLHEIGTLQVNAIKEADVVVVLLPGGKGTHTELGLALSSKKPVFLHSETSDPFNLGSEICSFYCVSNIQRVVCPLSDIKQKLTVFFDQKLAQL